MKILIAEDERTEHVRLQKFLKGFGYEVISCKDGLEAWETIQSKDAPNLLVLDWVMPGMSGVEVCRKVRELDREPYTYILLLTIKDDKDDIVEGMEAGADDYISKPFNSEELRVRLRAGKRIIELNRKLIEMRNELNTRATCDGLTGIWNRPTILEALEQEIERSKREQKPLGVVLLDIDFFKKINDTYGHSAGDEVLRETANRLKTALRSYDALGRYGGEEFLIVLPGCDSESAVNRAETLRKSLSDNPMNASDEEIIITGSFGISAFMNGGNVSADSLVKYADEALYQAKESGRNRVVLGKVI